VGLGEVRLGEVRYGEVRYGKVRFFIKEIKMKLDDPITWETIKGFKIAETGIVVWGVWIFFDSNVILGGFLIIVGILLSILHELEKKRNK